MKNEKHFKELVRKKIGNELEGKFRVKQGNVEISTDELITTKDYNLFIEVDSGNYAKLIVGQYVLLNELIKYDSINNNSKTNVFIIIHYYNRNTSSPYNSNRTKFNLSFINKSVFNNKGIKFIAFNLKEFKSFIKNISSDLELNNKIKEKLKNE